MYVGRWLFAPLEIQNDGLHPPKKLASWKLMQSQTQPYNNIMITNSSFTSGTANPGLEALLLPSFRVVDSNDYNHKVAEQIIQEHLLPETLHPMHHNLSEIQRDTLTRKPRPNNPDHIRNLTRPTILICSHNTRDTRCGVMGPLLQSEFSRQLSKLDYTPSVERPIHEDRQRRPDEEDRTVNVGLISHVGGHKWAGNVIIYLPPGWSESQSTERNKAVSPLAGCGVWYGRVEPKHVEGIIKETMLAGKVIQELFRGGIGPRSEILRLPLETTIRSSENENDSVYLDSFANRFRRIFSQVWSK